MRHYYYYYYYYNIIPLSTFIGMIFDVLTCYVLHSLSSLFMYFEYTIFCIGVLAKEIYASDRISKL